MMSPSKQHELALIDALQELYLQAWEMNKSVVYLRGIQFCTKQRMKILGLQAPTKSMEGSAGKKIELETVAA